jgi:nitrogen regulatory protein P-II 2
MLLTGSAVGAKVTHHALSWCVFLFQEQSEPFPFSSLRYDILLRRLNSLKFSRFSFLAHRLQYLMRISCGHYRFSTGGGSMKLVTVVIKPFKLEDVREALSSIGIQGLTVTEVKGFGRQKGHAELYRGAEYSVNFLPKVKIDVAIADDQLDEVIDVISKAAYTGKIGDGKIFVAELQRVIRIRTGEADEAAL